MARIEMAHGAGGRASRRLVEQIFVPAFPSLGGPGGALGDAAILDLRPGSVAISTDSFVVRPRQFRGGSIGDLAVNGTINDLAVAGAVPVALSAAFVLEEGLPFQELEQEVAAMAKAADAAGVSIVCGDTKVVERGMADGMYITTTGVGRVRRDVNLGCRQVRPGDKIVVSGPIGDHGITVLLARGGLDITTPLDSDTRPLHTLIDALLTAVGTGVRWMRDPTRGGVATSLNELAKDCGVGIEIVEELLPVRDSVRGACELLGLDPLHIACEGQFLAVVAPDHAADAIAALRAISGGSGAQEIGTILAGEAGTLVSVTPYGGTRLVDMLVGDPLPRIC